MGATISTTASRKAPAPGASTAPPPARRSLRCALVVAALLLAATPGAGLAHDPGLSAMTLEVHPGRLGIHLVVARREIEPLVTIDTDGNGVVSAAELAVARPYLQSLATTAVAIDAERSAIEGVTVDIDDSDGLHLRLALGALAGGNARVTVPLISRLALGHRQYVQVRDPEGRLVAEHVLHASAPSFAVPLDGAAPVRGNFMAFLRLGIEHIATGYDHLLFLVALLIVGPRLRTASAIITSFTAAHSVTLALATLGVVRLAPAVVEPLIAASVLYVGIENLRARPLAPRWIATFVFGLVHGLGFATVLRDLGVGAAGDSTIVPLLAFNGGVEVGQLAVAATILSLIWTVQRRPRMFARVGTACSVVVALAGAGWLLQRTLFAWI